MNLEPVDVTRKTAVREQYYRYDRAFKDSHNGDPWLSRQYYRWERGTSWAISDSDGRCQVFVVRNGLAYWYRQTADDRWDGPRQLARPSRL